MTIPAEYQGLPVTKVVLTANDYARVVRMPSSVTHMEGGGWHRTGTLKELHVDSVKSYLEIEYSNYDLGGCANCWDLYVGDVLVKEINISEIGYQGHSVFGLSGCQSIEKVDLTGGNITYLGHFEYCKNLKEINAPSSITAIGRFWYCSSLQEFKIPYSVAVDKLEGNAFMECTGMKKISYPAGRTYKAVENLKKSNPGIVVVEY